MVIITDRIGSGESHPIEQPEKEDLQSLLLLLKKKAVQLAVGNFGEDSNKPLEKLRVEQQRKMLSHRPSICEREWHLPLINILRNFYYV
jgi:hypothetical protein